MISIDGLAVEFSGTTLFSDISFVINEKDRIALMGKNGAGKSTLMNILTGQFAMDSGEVIIGGQSLLHMKDEERTVFRRRNIGFIFQAFNLSDCALKLIVKLLYIKRF